MDRYEPDSSATAVSTQLENLLICFQTLGVGPQFMAIKHGKDDDD